MSALPRFRVRLTMSRALTIEIDARNAQAAEDIARYLRGEFGTRYFEADEETIVDARADEVRA